jgi:fucose permease
VIAHRVSGPLLGRAYGTLMLGAGIGGAIGPVVISTIVERGGTYTTAFAVASVSAILAVPLFFLKA